MIQKRFLEVASRLGSGTDFGVHIRDFGLATGKDSTSLHTLDARTLETIAPPIRLALISGQEDPERYEGSLPIAHAALTPGDTHIITNRGVEGGLNVVDLVSRTTWALPLPDIDFTGGVAINRQEGPYRGLIAVHARDEILLLQPSADYRSVTTIARQPIGRPGYIMTTGPGYSLAFSGDGRSLVVSAESGDASEFIVFEIGPDNLTETSRITACPESVNIPNAILTTNEITGEPRPRPRPTRTPLVEPTPTLRPVTPTSTPHAPHTIYLSRVDH